MKSQTAADMKRARKAHGWTQAEAATRLGVSQGYVSLLESGRRQVPYRLVRRLQKALGLPVTTLPSRESNLNPDRLPAVLGALGYEPFGYLRVRPDNPSNVLLAALRQKDLPSRVVEGLPWLVLRHPDLDWEWLVDRAKVHDVQNRLGYVLVLASRKAEEHGKTREAKRFRKLARQLEPSRLAREDTLCHDSMTEAERQWLREERPPEAEHWNVLTNLTTAQLRYAV